MCFRKYILEDFCLKASLKNKLVTFGHIFNALLLPYTDHKHMMFSGAVVDL